MSEIRLIWKTSGAGIRLILVNATVFVLVYVSWGILKLVGHNETGAEIINRLVLPGDLSLLVYRPWTLITHMFIHLGVLHLVFNMITLYFSYQLFSRYFDDRKLVNVYFTAGLTGVLVFLLSVNLFPFFSEFRGHISAAGASAATLGVLVAICLYRPKDTVQLFGIFTVQLRWVAITFILLDLVQLQGGNEAGHLAHLGGAFFGLAWADGMKKQRDYAAFLGRFISLFRLIKRPKNGKVRQIRPLSDETYNEKRSDRQRRVDAILDKITRSGYDSLTKEEKRILFEFSKEK